MYKTLCESKLLQLIIVAYLYLNILNRDLRPYTTLVTKYYTQVINNYTHIINNYTFGIKTTQVMKN
jgi:hypothetical protein